MESDKVRRREKGIKKQGRERNSAAETDKPTPGMMTRDKSNRKKKKAKTNKPTPGMMTRGNQVFMCVWGKRRQP